MIRRLALVTAILVATATLSQTTSQRESVLVNAVAQSNSITLSWPNYPAATGYIIYRKLKQDQSWGSALGSTTLNSFTDAGTQPGVYYEYKVVRASSQSTGYGYIAAGSQIQPTDYQGRILLVVESSLLPTLASQLDQLQQDWVADGWSTSQIVVDNWASVTSVRTAIQAVYGSNPDLKAVLLFGHIPVPYSGYINPDGHSDHLGAWAADGYYGDMDGVWTDNTVNGGNNTPGDGKFDQSYYPSQIELQVGRVDFFKQGSYNYYSGISATTLYSNYLAKLHSFKTKQFTPLFRGAVFDNFEDMDYPSSAAGYRVVSANVGVANMSDLNGNGPAFSTYINNQSYLWTYSCGGGGWTSCANVATTYQMATLALSWGGVFNMSFGSYFGDWNVYDNFLIAPLGSGKALTNAWAGMPYWWFHHMGMGDHIGYDVKLSMNNQAVYTPVDARWDDYDYRVHMAFMGDPTLRQVMVNMPSNLAVASVAGNCSFSWQPAGEVLGYHLYQISSTGLITRITTNPVTTTSFNSTVPYVEGSVFMVRSVVLQIGATGTYYNLSLGNKAVAGPSTTNMIRLSAKVKLGGPYKNDTGLMTDSLRVRQLLPSSQPYTALGYTHTANNRIEQVLPLVFAGPTGPDAIVDWVLVELRDPNTSLIVGSRTGLLQRDGDVVEIDGISPLEFDLPNANYKVAVRHRNHLGVVTANSFALSTNTTAVDLSTVALSGTQAHAANGTLWCGDVDFNGQVKYVGSSNDRDLILLNLGGDPHLVGTTFYSGADVNMDGMIRYTGGGNDRDPVLVTVGSITPNNTRIQQIP